MSRTHTLLALASLLALACSDEPPGALDASTPDGGALDARAPDTGAPDAGCTDDDGDGYAGRCDGDCDESDRAVHPSAPDVCNGVDDDCSGTADEGCDCTDGATRACGSSEGACEAGTETCAGGAWGACVGAVEPIDEACDGELDDDCDAAVDEGCACVEGDERLCSGDEGACEAGRQSCTAGTWGECVGAILPVEEACDGGLDDDCDAMIDEGCACTNGAARSCGSETGACASGTETCTEGAWGVCVGAIGAAAEACDGALDEDCDGAVDEGCPPVRAISTRDSRAPQIALGAGGEPHVMFVWWTATGDGLAHARWDEGRWVIDESVPAPRNLALFSFALDADDRPIVLECATASSGIGPVVVISDDGAGGWASETVSAPGVACMGSPHLFRDASGRLDAFVETLTAGTFRLAHYRREPGGAWQVLPPVFEDASADFDYAGYSVSRASDGSFRAVAGRLSTVSSGTFVREVQFARAITGGWAREPVGSVSVPAEPKYVAVDTAGIAHVAHGTDAAYFRRSPPWSTPVFSYFREPDDGSSTGAALAADASGGIVAAYGGITRDQYVVRRRAADGTLTTLERLPSTGLRNDYVGLDLLVEGGAAHVVYTALECTSGACTGGAPRIHYARIAL